jgi:hypothetical protein
MFTVDNLRALLQARPFVPFRLIRSDGDSIDIRSSEQVLLGRQFAMVGLLDPDATDTTADRFLILWYFHVTGVETLSPGKPPFTSPGEPPSGTPTPTPAAGS